MPDIRDPIDPLQEAENAAYVYERELQDDLAKACAKYPTHNADSFDKIAWYFECFRLAHERHVAARAEREGHQVRIELSAVVPAMEPGM